MKESSFQFKNPSLSSMKFHENKYFSLKNGNEIEIQTHISVSNSRIASNKAIVKLQIVLGEENSTAPFYLETIFMAEFNWEHDLTEKDVTGLLDQNAPALLLSYARPIISLITNASHFPAYNIPFINFKGK